MPGKVPGPICGWALGPDWIDKGTMALTRSSPPGCIGLDVASPELIQGSGWRTAYLLEYGGTYRLMYGAEALEIALLEGQVPK